MSPVPCGSKLVASERLTLADKFGHLTSERSLALTFHILILVFHSICSLVSSNCFDPPPVDCSLQLPRTLALSLSLLPAPLSQDQPQAHEGGKDFAKTDFGCAIRPVGFIRANALKKKRHKLINNKGQNNNSRDSMLIIEFVQQQQEIGSCRIGRKRKTATN